jgi:hypothetical protein
MPMMTAVNIKREAFREYLFLNGPYRSNSCFPEDVAWHQCRPKYAAGERQKLSHRK